MKSGMLRQKDEFHLFRQNLGNGVSKHVAICDWEMRESSCTRGDFTEFRKGGSVVKGDFVILGRKFVIG